MFEGGPYWILVVRLPSWFGGLLDLDPKRTTSSRQKQWTCCVTALASHGTNGRPCH
jgi:hypothetical protein